MQNVRVTIKCQESNITAIKKAALDTIGGHLVSASRRLLLKI